MKRVIFSSLERVRNRASPYQEEGGADNRRILDESDIAQPKVLKSHHKDLISIEAAKHEIIRGLIIFLIISEAFLFLRIILRAMGANPNSFFSGFIYIVSSVFLIPFLDIFPQLQNDVMGSAAFDAAAVIAFFSYLLLIPLIMLVVYLVCNILKTRRNVKEIVKKDTPVDTTVVDDVMV